MGRPLWVRRRSAWRLWRKNTTREYWPFQAVSQKMQEHVMNMASTPFSRSYGEQCHWKRQWSGRMLPGIWQTRQSRYSGCLIPASNEIKAVFGTGRKLVCRRSISCRVRPDSLNEIDEISHPWDASRLKPHCSRHFRLISGDLSSLQQERWKGGSV